MLPFLPSWPKWFHIHELQNLFSFIFWEKKRWKKASMFSFYESSETELAQLESWNGNWMPWPLFFPLHQCPTLRAHITLTSITTHRHPRGILVGTVRMIMVRARKIELKVGWKDFLITLYLRSILDSWLTMEKVPRFWTSNSTWLFHMQTSEEELLSSPVR